MTAHRGKESNRIWIDVRNMEFGLTGKFDGAVLTRTYGKQLQTRTGRDEIDPPVAGPD